MKNSLITLFFISIFNLALSAQTVEFTGVSYDVIKIKAEKKTGLDDIFVAFDSKEMTELSISGMTGDNIEISRYGNLGGGYAEPIYFNRDSGNIIIPKPEGNMGYLVKSDEKTYYFWLVDYSDFPFNPQNITLTGETDCDLTRIIIQGEGSEIPYFSIDGRRNILDREISVSYETLEWDDEQELFLNKEVIKNISSINGAVVLNPPFYCNTDVQISGDRFLKIWKMNKTLTSEIFHSTAVDVNSKAEQTNMIDEEDSNVIKTEDVALGGSAPADITFYGYVTDGVLHKEWQMASDPEFEYILYRFNDQDVSYSFTEEGTFYMRFIGSNSDGSCESIGESYRITIGSSELRIPNAFSPNNDGINDVWKVGYRSLLSFKCWIFDSKGTEIYFFNDPSGGWDGTYHGKTVRPGVYYYVIQATGADGTKYKKSGDINILNYRKYGESTGSVEE